MKRQYGLLAMLFAMAIPAYAEQPATEVNDPPTAAQVPAAEENDPPAAAAQVPAAEEDDSPAAAAQAPATEESVSPGAAVQGPDTEMTEQAGFSTGSVVRSALTSAVEDREPTDNLEIVDSEQNQLYFFTELRDMSGQTAKHRWEYDGKVMAEVEFDVKGPRWRVWSSKSFVPGWTGDWKVSVINGAGDVISEKNFTYETAAAGQEAQPVSGQEREQAP